MVKVLLPLVSTTDEAIQLYLLFLTFSLQLYLTSHRLPSSICRSPFPCVFSFESTLCFLLNVRWFSLFISSEVDFRQFCLLVQVCVFLLLPVSYSSFWFWSFNFPSGFYVCYLIFLISVVSLSIPPWFVVCFFCLNTQGKSERTVSMTLCDSLGKVAGSDSDAEIWMSISNSVISQLKFQNW